MTAEQAAAFMIEYEALCRRHGMMIESCGCCSGCELMTRDWSRSELTWQSGPDGPYRIGTDSPSGFTVRDGKVERVERLPDGHYDA